MSMMDLFRPEAGTAALRLPEDHETTSIASVLLHIPTPRLAQIADSDLAGMIGRAIEMGGGILQIGLCPSDLEIQGGRFAARCLLRLTTLTSKLEIRFEGGIDDKGRCAPEAAILLAQAA